MGVVDYDILVFDEGDQLQCAEAAEKHRTASADLDHDKAFTAEKRFRQILYSAADCDVFGCSQKCPFFRRDAVLAIQVDGGNRAGADGRQHDPAGRLLSADFLKKEAFP